MANSLLTTSKITFECLDVLENSLGFAKAVNRDYDDQFAVNGAKIGSTVNVRKPPRYQVGSGPVIDPQATIDTYVPVTLTEQANVAMAFTSADLALNVDDFRERIIVPAMAALANRIDYLGTSTMYKQVANLVGTAGQLTGGSTTSTQALNAILAAGQKLDENAAPIDDMRAAVISPATNTGLVQAQASLFNPAGTISRQFTKGALGDGVLGFNFARDQNIVAHTYGTSTGGTTGASAQGASNTVQSATDTAFTLTISALTGTITAGTTITLGNVYAVNPQSRVSTGALQNFVVTADVANGATSMSIFPYPVFSGPFQNVTSSTGSIAAGATIALVGSPSASTAYPMNLMFHKNAFTLACADLPLPQGNGESSRAASKAAGLSVRLVKGWYDARTDQHISRIDVLFGWKAIYPELACKLQG